MEVTGHHLTALYWALHAVMRSDSDEDVRKLMVRVLNELTDYRHAILIRFEGAQLSLSDAEATLDKLERAAVYAGLLDFRLEYRRYTLRGQVHDGYAVKMGTALTEDELTFHGKLPDIINGVLP